MGAIGVQVDRQTVKEREVGGKRKREILLGPLFIFLSSVKWAMDLSSYIYVCVCVCVSVCMCVYTKALLFTFPSFSFKLATQVEGA